MRCPAGFAGRWRVHRAKERAARSAAGARREERREEEAEPGEPPPREEGEEAGCFLAHSRPARVTHSARKLPGPAGDPRAAAAAAAAADPGEEGCCPRPALQPRWGPGGPRNRVRHCGSGAAPRPRGRSGLGSLPRGLPGGAASWGRPGPRTPVSAPPNPQLQRIWISAPLNTDIPCPKALRPLTFDPARAPSIPDP